MSTNATTTTGERGDILAMLVKQRYFLRFTVRDLTDEQAAQRSTASELCLGGLIKHVAEVERNWVDFILGGSAAMSQRSDEPNAEGSAEDWLPQFRMLPGETLATLLDNYERVARRTDDVVATLSDLDVSHALPEAPWFEKGARGRPPGQAARSH